MARNDANINITATDRTGRAIKSARKNLQGLGTTARNVLGGLGVGIGVAGFSRITKDVIEYGAALDDTSRKLGVSAEMLQEWDIAARRVGVSQSAAEMGLQRFTRRVAEAVQGKGELIGVLKQYGIQVKNTDGTSRDLWDVMGDLSDAIQSAESSGEQLRIAFKAFDSEGAALVNLLRSGSDGLDEFRASARATAGVISNETARSFNELSNAMKDVETRWKTHWAGLTVSVVNAIPALKTTQTELAVLYQNLDRYQRMYNIAEQAGIGSDAGRAAALKQILETRAKILSLESVLNDAADATEGLNDEIAGVGGSADVASVKVARLVSVLDQMEQVRGDSAPTNDSVLSSMDQYQDRVRDARSELAELNRERQILSDPGSEQSILQSEIAGLKKEIAGLDAESADAVEKQVELKRKELELLRLQKSAEADAARERERARDEMLRSLGSRDVSDSDSDASSAPRGRHLMGDYSNSAFRSPWMRDELRPVVRDDAAVTAALAATRTPEPEAQTVDSATHAAVEAVREGSDRSGRAMEEIGRIMMEFARKIELVRQQVANAR